MKERLFNKGDLKYIILDLMRDKPRYGYQIMRYLEDRSHGFYKPSPGTIYPTLRALQEAGYITSAKRDGKKVYVITKDGIEFIAERQDLADEIKGHMKRQWNPDNQAEIAKTMDELGRFNRLFGTQLLQLDPGRMTRIRRIISRACEDVEEIMDVHR